MRISNLDFNYLRIKNDSKAVRCNSRLATLKKDTVSFGAKKCDPQRADVDDRMAAAEKKVERIIAAINKGQYDKARSEVQDENDVVGIFQYFGWLYDSKESDVFLRSPYGLEYHFSLGANKDFSAIQNTVISAIKQVDKYHGELVPCAGYNKLIQQGKIDLSAKFNVVQLSNGRTYKTRNRYREKLEAKLNEQKDAAEAVKKAIENRKKADEAIELSKAQYRGKQIEAANDVIKACEKNQGEIEANKAEIFEIIDKYGLFDSSAREYFLAEIENVLKEIENEAKKYIPEASDDEEVFIEKQQQNEFFEDMLLEILSATEEIKQVLAQFDAILTLSDEIGSSDKEKALFEKRVNEFVTALRNSKALLKEIKQDEAQEKTDSLLNKISEMQKKANFLASIYMGYFEGENEEVNRIALLLEDVKRYKDSIICERKNIKTPEKLVKKEKITPTREGATGSIVQEEIKKPVKDVKAAEKITKEKLIDMIEKIKQEDISIHDKAEKILKIIASSFGENVTAEEAKLILFANCEVLKLFLPVFEKAIEADLIEKRIGGIILLTEEGINKYCAKKSDQLKEFQKTVDTLSQCCNIGINTKVALEKFDYEKTLAKVQKFGLDKDEKIKLYLEYFKNVRNYFFRNYKNQGIKVCRILANVDDSAVDESIKNYIDKDCKSFGSTNIGANMRACLHIAVAMQEKIDRIIEEVQKQDVDADESLIVANTDQENIEADESENFTEEQIVQEKEQLVFNPNFEKQIISKIKQLAEFIVEKYPTSKGIFEDYYSLLMNNLTNEDIQKIENAKTKEEAKECFRELYLRIKQTEEFKKLTITQQEIDRMEKITYFGQTDFGDLE